VSGRGLCGARACGCPGTRCRGCGEEGLTIKQPVGCHLKS
jgi:hypothetical protein